MSTERDPFRDAEIQPELGVREVAFADFEACPFLALQQGNVIVGLNGSAQFDLLEATIAQAVCIDALSTTRLSGAYRKKPLSSQLRPKNFMGELRDGTVFVAREDGEYAYDLLVAANLFSTGRGKVGTIAREVRYWGGSAIHGVSRRLGPSPTLKKARKIAEELNLASADRALNIARYALRHLYNGGLPQ